MATTNSTPVQKDMFLSKIAPEKLRPGLEQKYRFELQNIESIAH